MPTFDLRSAVLPESCASSTSEIRHKLFTQIPCFKSQDGDRAPLGSARRSSRINLEHIKKYTLRIKVAHSSPLKPCPDEGHLLQHPVHHEVALCGIHGGIPSGQKHLQAAGTLLLNPALRGQPEKVFLLLQHSVIQCLDHILDLRHQIIHLSPYHPHVISADGVHHILPGLNRSSQPLPDLLWVIGVDPTLRGCQLCSGIAIVLQRLEQGGLRSSRGAWRGRCGFWHVRVCAFARRHLRSTQTSTGNPHSGRGSSLNRAPLLEPQALRGLEDWLRHLLLLSVPLLHSLLLQSQLARHGFIGHP